MRADVPNWKQVHLWCTRKTTCRPNADQRV
jgi:hypothetical protein